MTFSTILIANRGEIACRIIRSAHASGFRTIAVHSEADADALHVQLACESVAIGPPPVGQSYLNVARIIEAARQSGADAIHPGYGFLSENAAFADACIAEGITFIGPRPDAIRAMGDKAESKRRMIAAGVPCVPGYQGADQNEDLLAAEAEAIGYPIMIKASAGGGGRGMRLVERPADFASALATAKSEARNAFGDDIVLLERAVIEPRHIEIQVFGDFAGNIVHLGERDCSIQRRHQKVIEESPSPFVDAALRERMGAAAVLAARSIDYVGAGTVEFLVDRNGEFYFLEMNTRLQVEHPVTECVTGLDLVALQLDVANGKPLPFTQKQMRLDGHAIEVRLYAEDAENQFLPQTGAIVAWQPAAGDGIRIDHGLRAGMTVSPYYDPMLAKVIAHGVDREDARRLLIGALRDTTLLGVTTNREFLGDLLKGEKFVAGEATTSYIGMRYPDGYRRERPDTPLAAALAAILVCGGKLGEAWRSALWSRRPVKLQARDAAIDLRLGFAGGVWTIEGTGGTLEISLRSQDSQLVDFTVHGHSRRLRFARIADTIHLDLDGESYLFEDVTYAPPGTSDVAASGTLRAPMSGLVIATHVRSGATVKRGETLCVLEAMKMEHSIVSPFDGTVESIEIVQGQQVEANAILLRINATENI